MKILVVDDDARLREVVSIALERAGFAVVTAGDGQRALTHAAREAPDLIVLDVGLPERDGVEVCRQIPHDRTKVLMLTARDDAETRDAAMAAGADRYMTKPFSAVELLDAARELLAPAS